MRGGIPSRRARLALNRLSRERWISGKECGEILRGWVGNNSAYRAAMAGCEYVGIIGGIPPAFPFEPHYGEVLDAVKSRGSDTQKMIRLLTILARKK